MDFLPMEICNLISEFDASHRERFAPTLRAIFLRNIAIAGVKSRVHQISQTPYLYLDGYDTDYPPPISYLLDKRLRENIEDPGYFVKMLSKCNCCPRHTNKRPKSLDNLNGSPGIGEMQSFHQGPQQYNCTCGCRHNSRWVIRACTGRLIDGDEYSDYEDEYGDRDY